MEYGRNNELEVLSKDRWFWELEGGVKLPFDQCGDETVNVGEKINVFVYMDIEKGLMGTLKTVFGQVGELAYLNVVNVSEMGVFLDLGIGKDVLLLKNKMETELKIGDDALVALRLDNKNRIGATMKISDYIEVRPNSTVGEEVSGIVYRVNDEMGIFVAVEGKYHGFIHNNKLTKKYFVGETVNAKIAKVRDDGKLELAFRDVAYKVMDNDAKVILDYLNKNKGIMTLNDDSSPEDIKRVFGISKKAFKRAIGKLYKDRVIDKAGLGFKIINN